MFFFLILTLSLSSRFTFHGVLHVLSISSVIHPPVQMPCLSRLSALPVSARPWFSTQILPPVSLIFFCVVLLFSLTRAVSLSLLNVVVPFPLLFSLLSPFPSPLPCLSPFPVTLYYVLWFSILCFMSSIPLLLSSCAFSPSNCWFLLSSIGVSAHFLFPSCSSLLSCISLLIGILLAFLILVRPRFR